MPAATYTPTPRETELLVGFISDYMDAHNGVVPTTEEMAAALNISERRSTFTPMPRQMELLRFITGYVEANNGVAPTLDEMAAALNISARSSMFYLLRGLEERGLIRRLPRQTRAIELLAAPTIPRAPDGAPLYFVPIAHASEPESRAA